MLLSQQLREQARIAETLAHQVSILSDREHLKEEASRLYAAADLAEQEEAQRRTLGFNSDEKPD